MIILEVVGEECINFPLLLHHITKRIVALNSIWRSEVHNQSQWYKIKLSTGPCSVRMLKGIIYYSPFSTSKIYTIPWLLVLFHLQSQQWHHLDFFFHDHISFTTFLLPSYKDQSDKLRLSPNLKIFNLTTSTKLPLQYKGIFSGSEN